MTKKTDELDWIVCYFRHVHRSRSRVYENIEVIYYLRENRGRRYILFGS